MKAFEKSKDKENTSSKLSEGSFEDMIKTRKAGLPDYEEEIQEQLEDYDGGLIAIIRVEEDENGKASKIRATVVGAAHISSQLRLIRGLDKLGERLRDELIESAKGNVEAMLAIITEIADDATKEVKIKNGKK